VSDLNAWLKRLETRHPLAIDLGLDRAARVYARLGHPRPAPLCITVGGTNGKGSTVAFLRASLAAAGLRVAAYTSPHLLRYNERINIGNADVSDQQLVEAFEIVEAALGQDSLSYFEFGTLAAFVLMAGAQLDVAILEVGLGGRLDVVNLIDADAAILTSIDLDHQEYLGNTRELIGFEKAHIFRAGRPAIVADPDPPDSVLNIAKAVGAQLYRIGIEFRYARRSGRRWRCTLPDGSHLSLPDPTLAAPCQHRNATAAVGALWALRDRWPWSAEALNAGIATATVRGRLERLARQPETWVDVAHNPEAARNLAEWMSARAGTRRIAIFAALADKDIAGIIEPLRLHFDAWIVFDLASLSARAMPLDQMAERVRALVPAKCAVKTAHDITQAFKLADEAAAADGCILVFGSFYTVTEALKYLG